MGKPRTLQHYSDAGLLNFLDGELGLVQRLRARLHLFRCWECRARKAELEAQAHRFARAVRDDVFPGQQRVFNARLAFETRRRQFEDSQAAYAASVTLRRTRGGLPVASAATVLVLAAMVGYLKFVRQSAASSSITGPVEHRASTAPLHRAEEERLRLPEARGGEVASKASQIKRRTSDAATLELDVHYRLHRIGACAAEPVLISRHAALPIVVSMVGPPEERKQQIHAALADLERSGQVRVEITEVGQALGSVTGVRDLPPVRSSSAFAQGGFARQFGTPDAFIQRANAILSEVDTIYAHAWALRKHSSVHGSREGSPGALFWLREAMERDHVSRLRQALSRLNVELRPALDDKSPRDPMGDGDLFEYSKEAAALIYRLFAPAVSEELNETQAETGRLGAILAAMDRELNRVEERMSRSLPVR